MSTVEYVLRWELCVRCKDAVAEAFSVESNLASWAAVGAVPFTMICLSDDNVRHDGNDVNDPRIDHELDGNVERLTNKDLEVLLRWKGVLPSKMGNMANKRALYQQFVGNRGDDNLGDPARWMEVDKANLEELRNAPIEMGDTTYGRFEAGQKRDAERAYQKMTLAEKESFRWKMAEINEADADDGQSPPFNPTTV